MAALLLSAAAVLICLSVQGVAGSSFTIDNNRFWVDSEPVNLISGCVHYFRIPPAYWRDRLQRLQAMGLNTIEMYIPWNFHEVSPGEYRWDGEADVESFLRIANDLGLLVMLRPGPYICAEWDFGGLPWWLASSKVQGGRTMITRSDDPDYLFYVERWWSLLFQRMEPLLLHNGGPIVMVQIENEYGFCGPSRGAQSTLRYLRELVRIARDGLGPQAVLYTTDPPNNAPRGTLPGEEVFTAVDFGAGWWRLDDAFTRQAALNPPGKSPPICTEFYTGWLTHWGEHMANTSADSLVWWFKQILSYANNSGSVSFYMAHGGTNFGFWNGANNGGSYQPHITSYDYDAPVSEAGDYGQPGIGGRNKFQMIREAVEWFTGKQLPPAPPPPAVFAPAPALLDQQLPLLDAVEKLQAEGVGAILADTPDIMEEYGQGRGLIVYRTHLPRSALAQDAVLSVKVHDFAQVLLDGVVVGSTDRLQPHPVVLPQLSEGQLSAPGEVVLDIVVEAMGRNNFGCGWDWKGIVSPLVTLDGAALTGWEVFPLPLDNVSALPFQALPWTSVSAKEAGTDTEALTSPTFFRATFHIPEGTLQQSGSSSGYLPDTFLDTRGWTKGVAWVNGFNLGWYWPVRGPQMTLYVPGPVLREGDNSLLLLEMVAAPAMPQALFVTQPDFYGPHPGALQQRPTVPLSKADLFQAELQRLFSNTAGEAGGMLDGSRDGGGLEEQGEWVAS